MPKKRITTGPDYSAALKPSEDFATQLQMQKGLEYSTKYAQWQAETARLEQIAQNEIDTYKTSLDEIMESQKSQGRTFNDNTASTLREMAKRISETQSKIALGDVDYQEGYEQIAKDNRALDALAGNSANMNALYNKIVEAERAGVGNIGGMAASGSGNTANLVSIVKAMYDPNTSGNVNYEVDEMGNSFYEMNGVKIPIEQINNIMSGENADYPITINEDPTQRTKLIHDELEKNKAVYMTEVKKSEEIRKGNYIQTIGDKTYQIDRNAYLEEAKNRVDVMLKDPKQFNKYWAVIGGQGAFDPSDPNMVQQAKDLTAKWMADHFLPEKSQYTEQKVDKTVESRLEPKDDKNKPFVADPNVQGKINVNRAMVAALHGGGDKKSPYRYDGKIMTGSRLASRLNDAVPAAGTKYFSINQVVNDPSGFGLDDNAIKRFKKMMIDDPLNKKNIYQWDGKNLTSWIDGSMSIDAMNQRVDEVFKIDPKGYTTPVFEERKLHGIGGGTWQNKIKAAAERHGPNSSQVEDILRKLNLPPKETTVNNKKVLNPQYAEIRRFWKSYNDRPNTPDLPDTVYGMLDAMKIMNRDYLTNTLKF